ncbi:MAG: nucleoside deaminase [Candidatus Cloacimonetes bacterium]|nr:nucleoside deaminase [Candidatus Cloacimonadota bacterium]
MEQALGEADERFMREALAEAEKAFEAGEVPVGAVLVRDGAVVARAHNITRRNPLGHAEKRVIEQALADGEKFLYEYSLYVTLEPCLMCAGCIVLSRVGQVVFGAHDPKAGAVGSLYHVLADRRLNHRPQVRWGVLAQESAALLRKFFVQKRAERCRSG